MKIIRSRYAGACYGVKRALDLVDAAASAEIDDKDGVATPANATLANAALTNGAPVSAAPADGVFAGSTPVPPTTTTTVPADGVLADGVSVPPAPPAPAPVPPTTITTAPTPTTPTPAAPPDSAIVYTLGPLIHNPQVVSELRLRGVLVADTVADAPSGTLVIRSHGVAPSVIQEAQAKGLLVIDATCPHVAKAQRAAKKLQEQGYQVLIVGGLGHPEVESIKAYAGDKALVVQEPADLPETFDSPKIGVVVQTTQTEQNLAAVVDALHARGIEPVVHSTICSATRQRQEAASELAQKVDVMLVIGGRNSSNTTRLTQLCQKVCPHTYHIEQASELDPTWFTGAQTVGITAGASTPEDQITTVEQALKGLL